MHVYFLKYIIGAYSENIEETSSGHEGDMNSPCVASGRNVRKTPKQLHGNLGLFTG